MIQKKSVRILLLVVFIYMLLSVPVYAAGHVELTIIQPSAEETMIAPDRSFYVRGSFSGDTDQIKKVKLEMKKKQGNKVVRTIESGYTGTMIETDKGFPLYWGLDKQEIARFGMPDLLYDIGRPDTVKNGDKKCYFDEKGFAVLVPNSKGDEMGLVKEDGTEYEALENGTYTITVTALGETDTRLGSTDLELTIGVTEKKVMARFSPDNHKTRVDQFAKENGFRIYNDMMPGYWSVGDNFCEIQSEWRYANAAEYKEGNVHFVIYNVKAGSATYGVELATLQLQRAIDSRLTNYYYQYGEPFLKVNGKMVASDIVPFDQGDKLQFARAEINPSSKEENTFNQAAPEAEDYDLDFSDGITVQKGETLSLYGTAAPIQINEADIQEQEKGTLKGKSYLLKNKIASLHYTITGQGIKKEYEKEILLHRVDGASDYPSELEFRHDIPITQDMAGKTLRVQVIGKDNYGNKVTGSQENLTLKVKSAQKDLPQSAAGDETDKSGKAPASNEKNESAKAENSQGSSQASTGDETDFWPWVVLLVISGGSIFIIAVLRKRS